MAHLLLFPPLLLLADWPAESRRSAGPDRETWSGSQMHAFVDVFECGEGCLCECVVDPLECLEGRCAPGGSVRLQQRHIPVPVPLFFFSLSLSVCVCVDLFKSGLEALLSAIVGVICPCTHQTQKSHGFATDMNARPTLCEDPLKCGHLRRLWQSFECQSPPAVHRAIGEGALVSPPFRPRVHPLHTHNETSDVCGGVCCMHLTCPWNAFW